MGNDDLTHVLTTATASTVARTTCLTQMPGLVAAQVSRARPPVALVSRGGFLTRLPPN